MAGAAAAGGAMADVSAAVVQVTQVNNQYDTISMPPNTVNGDFTGDGVIDRSLSSTRVGTRVTGIYSVTLLVYATSGSKRAVIGSAAAISGFNTNTSYRAAVYLSAIYSSAANGPTPQNKSALMPLLFTDSRINGGAPTNSFVEIQAFNTSPTVNAIRFLRIVFNDAGTGVPSGVVVGGTKPEWVSPSQKAAQRSVLARKIKKLKRKQRASKAAGKITKARKFKKKIGKLKKRLRAIV